MVERKNSFPILFLAIAIIGFNVATIFNLIDDTSPQLGGNLDPNGFGIIGETIPCTLAGGGGFVEYIGYGRGMTVLVSDTNAYVAGTCFVAIGGLFKIQLVCRTDTTATIVSGVIYINAQTESEAFAYNIANAVNFDPNLHTKDNIIIVSTIAYMIGNLEHVGIQWSKNDAGTPAVAGNMYVYSIYLIRQ
jgi:hypothetical protein